MLGSLRAVAQMVSYEVRLAVVLLRVVVLRGTLSLAKILTSEEKLLNLFLLAPIGLI